jgi:hypothetical protein
MASQGFIASSLGIITATCVLWSSPGQAIDPAYLSDAEPTSRVGWPILTQAPEPRSMTDRDPAEAPRSMTRSTEVTFWALGWLSSGRTKRSKNANVISPLLGDPTSTLDFDELDSTVSEAGVQLRIRDDWFVRGSYGRGDINSGRFVDDDFVTAEGAAVLGASVPDAHMFSRSISDIGGDSNLWYVTADLGRRLATSDSGKGKLDGFVGIQFWREHYEVFRGIQVVCTASSICNAPGTVFDAPGAGVTNTVEWTSFRVGVSGQYEISRVRLDGNLAFIPYTKLFSRDSHLARDDLRKPSFTMEGEGIGAEGEVGLSVRVLAGLYMTVGYRYWWLKVLDGTSTNHPIDGMDTVVPLTEYQTMRHGVTFGASYRF